MSSNIEVKLDVLNQKASPALYAASLANRPAASFTGRLFVDSDSPSTGIYRDTGTSWVQIADQGAGTTGTLQQVTTNGNTTNKGISITSIGLNTNLIDITNQALSSQDSYIGQTMGNSDFWKIYGYASVSDQSEMVFQVGDNGSPFNPTGQRFRFNYDASGLGTAKDVLIVDYNLSYFNTNLGINTDTPGTPLDVHGTTGVIAQLENTTTQNTLLSFRNQGDGIWSIGNNYNAGANDYIIYDAISFVNRFTIKSTGQTFIGADTTSSGLLVVNSATSDNHIVCIGANAPSIRLRNTGSSPTLNAGIGISTATNNFIQGSASGNYCIFNSSTTASPILFGIYNSGAGNTQEAARISSASNLLVGTVIDSGQKFIVSGTSSFSSNLLIGTTSTINANFQLNILTNSGNGGIILRPNADTTFPLIRALNAAASASVAEIGTISGISLYFSINGSTKFTIKSNTINVTSIPTSAVGLVSGDIYSNLGVLTIVP